MAFPQDVLPIKVEFDLNGWTDVTSYVRSAQGINITRGRQNESSQTERTTATLTLENTTGRFSERNPMGPYYELLSLNTPCRISVPADSTVLMVPGGDVDYVSCPDAAALDIIGDIDIRADVHLYDWVATPTTLACKWRMVSPTVQRSWAFVVQDGFLKLWWTTGGTNATKTSASSTARVPVTNGRLAVRAVLDVNNGASGNTTTFYTSDSISGTWTQLGDPVVAAGTTSIFSSSARLEVGGYGEAAEVLEDLDTGGTYGTWYAFQLRNGIAGTVVANPTFSSQTPGATSFADTASSPNTWTLTTDALITDRSYRFHGEVSSWPQTWDGTGREATVGITAAGILRRLTQGPRPTRSTLYRAITAPNATPPLAYWPCEDAVGSTTLASALPSGQPMTIRTDNGTPTLASYDGFPCSAPIPLMNRGNFYGPVPSYTATTSLQFLFLLSIPEGGIAQGIVPTGLATLHTSESASVSYFIIQYLAADNGSIYLDIDDSAGFIPDSTYITDVNGRDMCVSLELSVSGSTISYALNLLTIGENSSTGVSGNFTGTIGIATSVNLGFGFPGVDLGRMGHAIVRASIVGPLTMVDQLTAYPGETAGTRFQRLCAEERIAFRGIGDPADTAAMGVQQRATLVDLLRECAAADLGMMLEPLEVFGLGYRTRKSLETQTNGILASYSAHELETPPIPTGDDEGVRNDITLTRTGGTSVRRELATGRMSSAEPSDGGVGRYAASETVNLAEDSQLEDQAAWRLFAGTVDEERYPSISISRTTPAVVANAALNRQLLSAQVGHVIGVDNMPSFVAPGQLRQMVQGWTERLGNRAHSFTFNTSPNASWDTALLGGNYQVDTDGSELSASITSTATSFKVLTTAGNAWTTNSADLPFDIIVSGEVMRVTAVTPDITFEGSVTGWSVTGGSVTQSNTRARSGTYSALMTTSGSPSQTYLRPPYLPVVSGVTYSVSFWLYSVGGITGNITAAIDWFNSSFAYTGGVYTAGLTLPAAKWTQFRAVGAAPANGYMTPGPTVEGTPANGTQVWIDDIEIMPMTEQTLTVTRSINGVIKAQAAGAAVHVRYPSVTSL